MNSCQYRTLTMKTRRDGTFIPFDLMVSRDEWLSKASATAGLSSKEDVVYLACCHLRNFAFFLDLMPYVSLCIQHFRAFALLNERHVAFEFFLHRWISEIDRLLALGGHVAGHAE